MTFNEQPMQTMSVSNKSNTWQHISSGLTLRLMQTMMNIILVYLSIYLKSQD